MSRVLVMGVDALVLPLVKRFVQEGQLPNFGQILAGGACSYALPVIPPYTPTNWATIASGALPGRHGAGNWNDVTPNDPLERVPISTFDSRTLHADTLWAAASRSGRSSLLITYPGSYPTSLPGVTVVAPLYRNGLAGHSLARGGDYWLPLSDGDQAVFALETKERGNLLRPTADGHEEVEQPLPESLPLFTAVRQEAGVRILWGSQDLGFAAAGTWSSWATITWPSGQRASVRFKVLAMETARVHLLRSEIYPVDSFTYPPDYARDLFQVVGPFIEHPATVRRDDDLALTAIFEEIRDQVDWYGGVVRHAAQHRPWALAMMHWHWVDTAQHAFLAGLDPEPGVAPSPRSEDALRESYRLADRLLGHMLAILEPEDHLIVVSDHGCVPNRRIASITRRLVEQGLVVLKEGGGPRETVDATRSKVLPFSPHELVVNLAGRNATGIVPPEEFERVRDAAIDALLDWRDPGNGKRVVGYAFPKEHQALLGYWGDRCGDVMFLFNSGYSWGTPSESGSVGRANGISNHGPQLPTTVTDRSANMATLIAYGPRIRQGYERPYNALGYVSLTDVAPLVAGLLGVETPRDCRGAAPRDFLI